MGIRILVLRIHRTVGSTQYRTNSIRQVRRIPFHFTQPIFDDHLYYAKSDHHDVPEPTSRARP